MKEFIKYTLATIVGMIIVSLLTVFVGIMMFAGALSTMNTADVVEVDKNSVMVINLSGTMNERSQEVALPFMSGLEENIMGLEDYVKVINKARDNENIKGIYIEAGLFAPDSYASLQEMRDALLKFKKSGKWIIAYGDTYTQGAYYLASVADSIYLNPEGHIEWKGMASTPIFFKDLMAKFGVKMQLAKVGAYKSAPETFTADKMSDANREQITAFITGIWENVKNDVAESRKISADSLDSYADRVVMFDAPENYKKMRLIDDITYARDMKPIIRKQMGLDEDEDINQITAENMVRVKGKRRSGEEIAVYYACGDIVDDVTGISTKEVINGRKVCKDLEELENDDDIKAVVLRINSGGGSAYASEQMWYSIQRLKTKKPVVVSMGGMAASGGYYMSCIADKIIAEPTTLTGSIGIFGMFPDVSGLLTQKLGVKFDEVKTNRNSTFGATLARPFNEEEMSYLNTYIDRGYNLFRQRVADGRKMSVEEVEKVAQGHVWLGQDAVKIGLVDKLGTLEDAVNEAAILAKLDEYYTHSYPAKKNWLDMLTEEVSNNSYIDNQLRSFVGEYYEPLYLLKTMNMQNAIQARIPFSLNVK